MTKFVSMYAGQLVLPGGAEIEPFATDIDLSEAEMGNPAVKGWIEAGHLVSENELAATRAARAEAELEAAKAALASAEAAAAAVQSQVGDGSEPADEPVIEAQIATMDKDALTAFLTGEGVEFDGRSGADALRDLALSTLALNADGNE
ncbi:hypothetical protein MHM39_14890 [Phaeobacter sp. CNT1-3]|nr:hypothetical protein [Phaeobacter sp. CNT1-3]